MRMTFVNIPPTLSLVMMSDMVIYLILRPNGPGIAGDGHRLPVCAGRDGRSRL
jgi:hypothetical protein